MDEAELGQVSRAAADVYEEFFVPALFREPARLAIRAAKLEKRMTVLDVACGTGILAREAAASTGATQVTGVDRNEGMLAVARRIAPTLTWRHGLAEALPFPEKRFDRVFCQFGLMFFEDRVAALREMRRVLVPGGKAVVLVWDALERTPGYAAMVRLLERLFGEEIADALRAPFALGDRRLLADLFAAAGIRDATVETLEVSARFPSIDAWVRTDIRGWTLAERIDDAQHRELLRAARVDLVELVQPDGSVAFGSPAHLATFGAEPS